MPGPLRNRGDAGSRIADADQSGDGAMAVTLIAAMALAMSRLC
jgi:hypothetical protein